MFLYSMEIAMLRNRIGHLAIVMRSLCGNEGRTVEIVDWLEEDAPIPGQPSFKAGCTGWLVFSPGGQLNTTADPRFGVFPDSWLMPIGPRPAETERPERQELQLSIREG